MDNGLEEFIENIKIYVGIVFGMLLILDTILIAYMYQENGMIFGYNATVNNIIISLLAVTAVLFILLIVFSVFLRIRQGDMYISIWDLLETMTTMLLPIDAKSKKEIMQLLDRIGNKEEIMTTDLWRKSTKGINMWNWMKFVFLFGFGSSILYVIIKSWLDMDNQRILMTVLGGLFVIVLYFWSIVCGLGVKKRPDAILDYIISRDLEFSVLNQDFSKAMAYGSQIYKGSEYIFIGLGKGMQVVSIEDIMECKVLRMAGWNPRRLFLPYYILEVSAVDKHIMKYGINPIAFYKLKNAIENIINNN